MTQEKDTTLSTFKTGEMISTNFEREKCKDGSRKWKEKEKRHEYRRMLIEMVVSPKVLAKFS